MVAPSANRLLEDVHRIPFRGWDFSVLGTRLVVEPPPWSFEEIVDACAASATSMLDMGTGGGEWLSSRRRPIVTAATESWSPNVQVAAARLEPLGISVVQDEGAVANVDQRPGHGRGRLAFRDAAFDLVVNRHEAFEAAELRRVLRQSGTFATQQTGSGSAQFHELLGLDQPMVEEFDLERAVAQLEEAGFEIELAQAGVATTVFADIGALAWYLTNVPWAVPDFDTDTFREPLLRLDGCEIRVPSARFVVQARA
jgi:SAM-dependent methyltransferase